MEQFLGKYDKAKLKHKNARTPGWFTARIETESIIKFPNKENDKALRNKSRVIPKNQHYSPQQFHHGAENTPK